MCIFFLKLGLCGFTTVKLVQTQLVTVFHLRLKHFHHWLQSLSHQAAPVLFTGLCCAHSMALSHDLSSLMEFSKFANCQFVPFPLLFWWPLRLCSRAKTWIFIIMWSRQINRSSVALDCLKPEKLITPFFLYFICIFRGRKPERPLVDKKST